MNSADSLHSVKKNGLKRKVSLRDSFRRRLREEATRTRYDRNGRVRRIKPLKKLGRAKRRALAVYLALKEDFLALPENKWCLICIVRREHGENILINLATEIHHFFGRIGRLLCYVPGFRPSCFTCRSWPHDHPKEAREWGLLAPAPLWNRFPGNGSNGS